MSAPPLRIENRTRGSLLAGRARRADGFISRGIGLLGRRSLEPGEGLVLVPCTSIHMLFMRFPIDVLYVDRRDQVVKVVRRLRPFRFSACWRGAHYTVELPAGSVDGSRTEAGDQLALVPATEAAA